MPNILWETDLGVIGLVISGLLSLTAYVVWSGNNREDRRVQASNNFFETQLTNHRVERKEWKNDCSVMLDLHREERDITKKESLERQDATTLILNELTEAIKESNDLHKERRRNG